MASPRLLIVDDDQELRVFLRTTPLPPGQRRRSHATDRTGQQALVLIGAESWDLLLLDFTLPDFSGVEICRRLRGSDDHTPVLMLTAHDDVREGVEALDAGADDYLTKPFSIEELLARVRAQLPRDPQRGVGRAVGRRRQHARYLYPGAAPQAGARRAVNPDSDRPRRGLHAEGGSAKGLATRNQPIRSRAQSGSGSW